MYETLLFVLSVYAYFWIQNWMDNRERQDILDERIRRHKHV